MAGQVGAWNPGVCGVCGSVSTSATSELATDSGGVSWIVEMNSKEEFPDDVLTVSASFSLSSAIDNRGFAETRVGEVAGFGATKLVCRTTSIAEVPSALTKTTFIPW